MSIERRLSQAEKAAAPHGDRSRCELIIHADDGEIVERYASGTFEDLRNAPLPDSLALTPGYRTHINLDDDRRSASPDDDESNQTVFILLPEKKPILD